MMMSRYLHPFLVTSGRVALLLRTLELTLDSPGGAGINLL